MPTVVSLQLCLGNGIHWNLALTIIIAYNSVFCLYFSLIEMKLAFIPNFFASLKSYKMITWKQLISNTRNWSNGPNHILFDHYGLSLKIYINFFWTFTEHCYFPWYSPWVCLRIIIKSHLVDNIFSKLTAIWRALLFITLFLEESIKLCHH